MGGQTTPTPPRPPIIDLVTDLFHSSAREARFHVADLIRIAVERSEAERMPQTTP